MDLDKPDTPQTAMPDASRGQEGCPSNLSGGPCGPPNPPGDREIPVRTIVWFGLAITLTVVAAAAAMWGLFEIFQRREAAKDPSPAPLLEAQRSWQRREPPEPQLQRFPVTNRMKLRADEEARLTSYGWVDPTSGRLHIPIERAMEILAERGLPAREARGEREEARTAKAPPSPHPSPGGRGSSGNGSASHDY